MTSALIAGVGTVPFRTPRHSDPYDVMAEGAVRAALHDAGIELAEVRQSYAGYVYGDSTAGQRALYRVGRTGAPIINVNNNCATGSTALWLARQAIESGAADCVLAFGFEQMQRGALVEHWADRPGPLADLVARSDDEFGVDDVPMAAKLFGGAGREYQERYGTADATFASITVKSRRHAAANPIAVFRDPVTVEEVLASGRVFAPLTRLQCCPPTCGASAAVLVSPGFARSRGIEARVRILAQAMATDRDSTFDTDLAHLVGTDLTASAAGQVAEASGVDPADVPVVELHDCFTANELLSYEALGLTPPGTAERFVLDGENTYGGRVVTNPSGGLLSKGHPLGATGLAQCAELVLQLRGGAGDRQVEGANLALQHNIGLGGAAVVTLYERTT